MKLPLLLTALLVFPFALEAAPNPKKKKNKRPAAQEPAVPADRPAAPADASPDAWHSWTATGGEILEARFTALENGILTVETKDKRTVRFPMARLSPADQKFARACKATQPRPPMSQEVISKAAARLDESVSEALKKAGAAPNAPATDAQFLRRVYLDTIGRIPTAEEAAAFLNDKSADRRATLINALLNSPGYTMHMFNWLADMLRVKDDYGRGAKAFLYEDWLKDQIAINRPWDAMVRDMLTADGKLNENGAAGFLLRDAQMPLDGVSNMLTTFLGADVSCAQCHDHPFAEWTQKDFYGMAAFFGASDGYHENTYRRIRQLARSAEGTKVKKGLVNQILGSNAYDMVDLPNNKLKFPADYKYDNAKPGEPVAPALIKWNDTATANPAYKLDDVKPSQLRNEFADWMTHPENPRFATAIANRVWKKIFGLAVQEPVSDLDDPAGAGNPELLRHIATYMKQAKFDLREFQRILLNTAAYQRQTSPAPEDPRKFLFPGPVLRRLSAEQAWDSIIALTAGDDTDHILLRRGDDLRETVISYDNLTMAKLEETIARVQDKVRAVAATTGGKKKGGQINPRALAFFYEGGKPQQRAGLVLARSSELPQPAPENHFLRLFGQSDRLVADTNTTDGSVPQMLQLMNGPVQDIITGGGTALAAAVKAATPQEKVASLYHSFLSRPPTAVEAEKATAALNAGLTVSDLAWVLLNSREFLFVQ
jgi:hypothetical protein